MALSAPCILLRDAASHVPEPDQKPPDPSTPNRSPKPFYCKPRTRTLSQVSNKNGKNNKHLRKNHKPAHEASKPETYVFPQAASCRSSAALASGGAPAPASTRRSAWRRSKLSCVGPRRIVLLSFARIIAHSY